MSCPVRGVEPRSRLGGGSAVELHRYGPCPQKIAIFVRSTTKICDYGFRIRFPAFEDARRNARTLHTWYVQWPGAIYSAKVGQSSSLSENLSLRVGHAMSKSIAFSRQRSRRSITSRIDLACSVSFVRGRLQEVGETQSTYGIAHRIAKMIPYNEPYQESLLEAVRAYAAAHPDDPEVRQLFH